MKDRKWTDDDEINALLNDKTANTADIARYGRIMQHRSIEAMNGLHDGLKGVMESIHRGAGLAAQKADEFAQKVKDASDVQTAQQGKLVLLTWVIAIATAVYVGINAVTVFEMSQANSIQRDMVAATNRAADATIAANELQRQTLKQK